MLPTMIKSAFNYSIYVLLGTFLCLSNTSNARSYSTTIEEKLNGLVSISEIQSNSDLKAENRMIGYSKESKVTLTLLDNTGNYQTVVRFKTGATENFDGRYDAYFWMGDAANSVIYSTHNSTDYSINSFSETYREPVRVVVNTNSPEDFTIAYNTTSNIEGYSILLIDKLEDELYILNGTDSITFSSTEEFSSDRFEILHYKLVSTSNMENTMKTQKAHYNNSSHTLTGNSTLEQITVFNTSGQVLLNNRCKSTSFNIPQALYNQTAIIVLQNKANRQVIKTVL